MNINDNYKNLNESYLFSTIAKKVSDFASKNPDTEIIKLGIGADRGVFPIGFHDVIERFGGHGVPVRTAEIHAHGFRAEAPGRAEHREHLFPVSGASRGIVLPDVGTVHAEIREGQLVPVERRAYLADEIVVKGGKEPRPDIRVPDTVAEAEQVEIPEHVAFAACQHPVEGI